MIVIKKLQEEVNPETPLNRKITFAAKDKVNGDEKEIGRITAIMETKDVLTVTEIKAEEFVIDGLCRALFSYAEKEGACTVLFKCGNENVLQNLGFIDNINIKNFFENKNCKK